MLVGCASESDVDEAVSDTSSVVEQPALGLRPQGDTELQPDLTKVSPELKEVFDHIDTNFDHGPEEYFCPISRHEAVVHREECSGFLKK